MNNIIILIIIIFTIIVILVSSYLFYNSMSQCYEKLISNNMTEYDIIYSIIAHESCESLQNMIENINKFNKNNTFLIILHLNNFMYNNFKITNNYTIINNLYYDKLTFSHLLLKAHVENYEYLIKYNIKFKNIMLLASNCLFIKQMIKPSICNNVDMITLEEIDLNKINNSCNHIKTFIQNKKILDIFINKKIPLYKKQHEGALYCKDLFNNIVVFINNNKIFNLIEVETVFEEILLVSLEKYFNNNTRVKRYCKVYWDMPNYTPTIDNIKEDLITKTNNEDEIYLVKRVPRDMNDPIRQFILSL